MNKHEAILELVSNAEMMQSVVAALRCLDEWDFDDEDVEAAKNLLRKKVHKMEKRMDELENLAAGGKLDIEAAFENFGKKDEENE